MKHILPIKRIDSLQDVNNSHTLFQWKSSQFYFRADVYPREIWVSMISYSTEILQLEINPIAEKACLHVLKTYKFSQSTTRHTTLTLKMLGVPEIAEMYKDQSFPIGVHDWEIDFVATCRVFQPLYNKWLRENP